MFYAVRVILFLKITTLCTAQNSSIKYCGNLTCFKDSKCVQRSNGDQFCMCVIGYTGSSCTEDINECKFGDPCFHRGKCQNQIGNYRCECFKGWLGEQEHCQIKNNSTNVRECEKGWFGEWCQDQCLNDSMCRSNEVCLMRNSVFASRRGHQCRCTRGWLGRNCTIDKDECLRNPCPNTATCTNTPGSFNCPCLSGWKGSKCDKDVDECLANPCQHSSNCTNTLGSYNCTCTEGWKGVNCDEDINECLMNPCNSSVSCKNIPGSFSCKGLADTHGVHAIIGTILGSLLFLLVCLLIGFVVIKRKVCKADASVASEH